MRCARVSRAHEERLNSFLPVKFSPRVAHFIYSASILNAIFTKNECPRMFLLTGFYWDRNGYTVRIMIHCTCNIIVLLSDFRDLFPRYHLKDDDNLTVITLCQKTEHDMSGWSSEVEEERESLLQQVRTTSVSE